MDIEFKYFHWAIPKPGQELYGLYDLFDNHLFLLSYDFETVWELKRFIKSKSILEIVDFSDQIDDIHEKIDNSVVEKWGVTNPLRHLFGDVKSLSDAFQDKPQYRQKFMIKNPVINENNFVMDDYKKDLQKQIFFLHYCLFQANNAYKYDKDSFFYEHLLTSAELGESYMGVIDKFLDISQMEDKDKQSVVLKFMKSEGLLYE
jgi:hypothetical protein